MVKNTENDKKLYVRCCYSCMKRLIVIRQFGKRGDFLFFCSRACFINYLKTLLWQEHMRMANQAPLPHWWTALEARMKILSEDLKLLDPSSVAYQEYRIRLDELESLKTMQATRSFE